MAEKNDSEYSVNSDDVPAPSDAQNAGAAGSPEGKSCSCCPCCCCGDFKEWINNHPMAVFRFQEMIFLHRPIPFAILIVLVNLLFFIYRKLGSYPISLFLLFCAVHILLVTFYDKINMLIDTFLFAQNINVDPSASNRIYTIEEIEGLYDKVKENAACKTVQTLCSSIDKTSVTGRAIYAGIFFCAFFLSLVLKLFWPCVVITNLLLILPGVLFHPQVYPKWKSAGSQHKEIKYE